MQYVTEHTLPMAVANGVADTNSTLAGHDASALLKEVTDLLALRLINSFSAYNRLELFRELSFQVSYGLPTAKDSAPGQIQHVWQRPPRFDLPPDIVGLVGRLAMERATLIERFGERSPSPDDIAELMRLTALHMQVDVARDIASLLPTTGKPNMGKVVAQKSGRTLTLIYIAGEFDFHAYQLMRADRVLDDDPADHELVQALAEGIPDEFRSISSAMRTELGFDMEDLFEVLGIGGRMNVEHDAEVLGVELQGYRSFLADQSAGMLAAFDYLTYSSDHLEMTDLRPSGTRHQKRRIVTHPYIVHHDIVMFNRDLQLDAVGRWVRYILNGDWPVPVSARGGWPELAAAIESRRNSRGVAFEHFVEAELDRIGLPWGLTSGANRAIGHARIKGEVDALVVDAQNGVLWVIEAKDMTSDQNLRSLQSELAQMTKTYWPQVQRAAEDIEADPPAVVDHALRGWARRPGVTGESVAAARAATGSVNWTVRPLIVIRDRSAAECLIDRTWDITAVSGLAQILTPAGG